MPEERWRIPFVPPRASDMAGPIDLMALAITVVAVFFAVLVFALIIFFSVRYRKGNRVNRAHAPATSIPMEVSWMIGLLAITLAIFFPASHLYLRYSRIPPGGMEIYVVGKQWMWKLQHPNGRWENNELHLPVGQPIVLTLASEDVIHSFFVPAFRLKQDVIPGTYTRLSFTPTRVGEYRLYCAEYCGTLHSKMTGVVRVMERADYEAWLRAGPQPETVASEGARLFDAHGCVSCHAPDSQVSAPSLVGLFGRQVPVQIPQPGVPLEETPITYKVADETYIRNSILYPQQEVRAGYRPIMSTYQNRLTEEEILKIITYIRSLQPGEPEPTAAAEEPQEPPPDAAPADGTRSEAAEGSSR